MEFEARCLEGVVQERPCMTRGWRRRGGRGQRDNVLGSRLGSPASIANGASMARNSMTTNHFQIN